MSRLFTLLPFLLPLYVVRFSIGPLPTTVLEIGIIMIAIAWLVTRKAGGIRDAWERSKPWHLPAGLWLIAGAIGVIVAGMNGFGTIAALGLFRAYFIEPLLIFFIGFDLVRTEEDRASLWRSFCIVTIILALWAGVQILTGWGIPHPWDQPTLASGELRPAGAWPGRRATGPFPFPNALALFVAPIVALATARMIQRAGTADRGADQIGRPDGSPLQAAWVDVATFVAGVAAIFFAQSDGGLVAVAAALFVALLLQKKTRIIAVALAAVAIIASLSVASLRGYVSQNLLLNDWSGLVRKTIWTETVTMLADRPVFGAGLAAYPAAIAPYHQATWMEIFQYPHNIVLNLWSEMGLIGIVAFAWIIVTWIRTGHVLRSLGGGGRPYVLPIVAAIVIHGLVDVPYFKNDLAVAFWVLILLTTTYAHKKTSTR